MPEKSKEKAGHPGGDEKKVKIETYGEEMVEKIVGNAGNSGRIYLPYSWTGCVVKVIKT